MGDEQRERDGREGRPRALRAPLSDELSRVRFDDWPRGTEAQAQRTEKIEAEGERERETERDRLRGGGRWSERGPHSERITDAYRSVA